MRIQLRLYKNHDKDLIMLRSYGVSIRKFLRISLRHYIAGDRVRVVLPESHLYEIGEEELVRCSLSFKDSSDEAKLFKQLKPRCRNQFCKAVMRDALDNLPLGVYFSSKALAKNETARLQKDPDEDVLLEQYLKLKKVKSVQLENKPVQGEKELKKSVSAGTKKDSASKQHKVKTVKKETAKPTDDLMSMFDNMLDTV